MISRNVGFHLWTQPARSQDYATRNRNLCARFWRDCLRPFQEGAHYFCGGSCGEFACWYVYMCESSLYVHAICTCTWMCRLRCCDRHKHPSLSCRERACACVHSLSPCQCAHAHHAHGNATTPTQTHK